MENIFPSLEIIRFSGWSQVRESILSLISAQTDNSTLIQSSTLHQLAFPDWLNEWTLFGRKCLDWRGGRDGEFWGGWSVRKYWQWWTWSVFSGCPLPPCFVSRGWEELRVSVVCSYLLFPDKVFFFHYLRRHPVYCDDHSLVCSRL